MDRINYIDNPPDELKIFELSLIWKEAAYNFAFWEHLAPTLDWDKAYREALPAVLATKNLHEYYLELMKFVALLRDGHTRVNFPESIHENPAYTSKLPIRVTYSNGEYVISNVKRCAGSQVKRWSVVKKVNGIDIHAYIASHIFPYIWHEKVDSAEWQINTFLSNGPLGSQVEFDLELDGEISKALLTRTKGDTDWLFNEELKDTEDFEIVYQSDSHKIAMANDQIAIITIDTMMNDDLPKHFHSNFPTLQKARGYIIDIRHNGGGNSTNSDAVASAFIEGQFQNQRSLQPIHIGAYKAWSVDHNFGDKTYEEIVAERGTSDWREKVYKIPRQMYYEESILTSNAANEMGWRYPSTLLAPLVVLTTANTASAAEDFLVIFEHMKRATFVGTASCGSTGMPLYIDLESGGSVVICTRRNTHIDGREFINIGVEPHVHFEPSFENLRRGYDTHMEKGLEVLRGKLAL